MLRAVLFDLDNTLILFDEEHYFRQYMNLVQREFSDLLPAEELGRKLLSATQALMGNRGRMSNLDYFMRMFFSGAEDKGQLILDRFERFYATQYDQLQSLTTPIENVQHILTEVQEMGLDIVIASNPLLPLNVQEMRLRWAGLEGMRFKLITHIGNMSYVKPQEGYYREICGEIGRSPAECLMVGNDSVNDMSASRIGIKTYLTKDSAEVDGSHLAMSRGLLDEKDLVSVCPDYEGPLSGVPKVAASLLVP